MSTTTIKKPQTVVLSEQPSHRFLDSPGSLKVIVATFSQDGVEIADYEQSPEDQAKNRPGVCCGRHMLSRKETDELCIKYRVWRALYV